ncbi:hypothetical protein RQN30_11895 [Arcanobacterium hippocoleae]
MEYIAKQFFPGFCRSFHTPKLIVGVHVEWHVQQFAVIVCHRGVYKVVKFAELVHIIPDFFVAGAENMRSVLVHVNVGYFLGVAVTADMVAPFDYEYGLAELCCFECDYCAKESASSNRDIVVFHFILLFELNWFSGFNWFSVMV